MYSIYIYSSLHNMCLNCVTYVCMIVYPQMSSVDAEHVFPELRPYHVLSNVRPTGITLGNGAYCSVEEVEMNGTLCAAKRIHEILISEQNLGHIYITERFLASCHLFSTLHHPHIVQFLGVSLSSTSQLPSLIMERLLTDLHDLLEQNTAYFPLRLKCSILHDVASGLSYLHERIPPIIHCDISATSILLNSCMVAKICGFGTAQVVHFNASQVMCPGTLVYMPPEAYIPPSSADKEVKYGVALDIFSFGVTAIFTVTQVFPDDVLPRIIGDRDSKNVKVRTELERRDKYMRMVYTQLRKDHPLIRMIELCLNDNPDKRPEARHLLHLLEETQAEVRDMESDMDKLQLLQMVHNQQVRMHCSLLCKNNVIYGTYN